MHGQEDTLDIYLLMRPFRQVAGELRLLVQPLHELENRLALGAEGYYSERLDAALLALRFDRTAAESLGHQRLHALVASTGVPTITPEQLSFERRCTFYLDHLTNYTTYVQHYRSASASESMIDRVLANLVGHIGGDQQDSHWAGSSIAAPTMRAATSAPA